MSNTLELWTLRFLIPKNDKDNLFSLEISNRAEEFVMLS